MSCPRGRAEKLDDGWLWWCSLNGSARWGGKTAGCSENEAILAARTALLELQHCFRQAARLWGCLNSASSVLQVEMSASGPHVACLVRPTHSPLTSPQPFFFFVSLQQQNAKLSRLPLLSPLCPPRYTKPVHTTPNTSNAQDAAAPPWSSLT